MSLAARRLDTVGLGTDASAITASPFASRSFRTRHVSVMSALLNFTTDSAEDPGVRGKEFLNPCRSPRRVVQGRLPRLSLFAFRDSVA